MRRDRPSLIGLSRFAIFWQFSVLAGVVVMGGTFVDLVRQPWNSLVWVSVAPVLLVLLGVVLAEMRPLLWASVGHEALDSGLSLSAGLVLASLFLWGPAFGLLVQLVATLTGELAQRKEAWRVLFNVCQYLLSLGAAALAIQLIRPGGVETLAHPMTSLSTADLRWMVPAWLVYHFVNLALVAGVSRGQTSWVEDFRTDFWFYTVPTLAVLAMSAVVVALTIDSSWPFMVILGIPTFAIYRASTLSWRLHEMAHRDELTGLPNRRSFEVLMSKALADASDVGTGVALLLLDLNEFKEINDTLGHPAGDELLKIIAERTKLVLRPGDVMLRLGGDEFAVIVAQVSNSSDAPEVAERLRAVISEQATVGGTTVSISASVGISSYPLQDSNSQALLRQADVAMYRAKRNQSGVELYDEAHDPQSRLRLALREALRDALDKGEVEVHFQPQFELVSGAMCGVEALLRWSHAGERIPPTTILALASQSDLSRKLNDYVLNTALASLSRLWRQGNRFPVSINMTPADLSAHSPRGADLVKRVMGALATNELPPWALRLEISGDRIAAPRAREFDTVGALADLGVTVSLDNFGAGLASIATLRAMPFAEVKIDRSLTSRMAGDVRDRTLLLGLIDIAHGLCLRVVAEGVENQETADLLKEGSCDVAQGFHFAPVLSPADLDHWLANHPADAVRQVRPLRAVGGSEG